MTHLTPEETQVLRATLGLSYWNRDNPTKNHLNDWRRHCEVCETLCKRGFMTSKAIAAQTREIYMVATPAGIEAARDQPWLSVQA